MLPNAFILLLRWDEKSSQEVSTSLVHNQNQSWTSIPSNKDCIINVLFYLHLYVKLNTVTSMMRNTTNKHRSYTTITIQVIANYL